MDRFWARVDTSGECWEWTGSKTKKGYGQFMAGGKYWRVHRFAWAQEKGEVPEGMFVCHKCDNPACVRVSHLFLGTNADNMADMKTKGRGLGRCGVGSGMGSAILTAEQVIEARRRHPAESYAQLAKAYGVSVEAMRNAIRGFTWKRVNHLEPPGSGGAGGFFRGEAGVLEPGAPDRDPVPPSKGT